MNDKGLKTFELNYEIYIKRQGELIDACFRALDENNNEHDVENATRHLEQMFGRATTAKKVYGTASHHFHMYCFGEIFNLHELPIDMFNDSTSWQLTIAKKNYEKNIELFKERDLLVLQKLKEMGSKYYSSYENIVSQKEFFPNWTSSYSKNLNKKQD